MSQASFTKICSHCGIKKPISAFLQLTGESRSYGSICADCRGSTVLNENKPDTDDFSSHDSRARIDAKTHTHELIKKKEHKLKTEEDDTLSRHKMEAKKRRQIKRVIVVQEKEKDHRKSYLEKSSFLGPQQTKERQRLAVEAKIKTEQQLKTNDQQDKLKNIDLRLGAYTPSQTGPQLKHQGNIFQQFKTWLGSSAPLTRSQEPAAQTKEQKNRPKPFISEQNTSFEEEVKQIFKPGTTRKK